VLPNKQLMADELDEHWEVLAEPVQTAMRRFGVPLPYEKLKAFTQGKVIDRHAFQSFINDPATFQGLPSDVADRLRKLTPHEYTGASASMAKKLVDDFLPEAQYVEPNSHVEAEEEHPRPSASTSVAAAAAGGHQQEAGKASTDSKKA
jgi:hypothetical protein